MARLIRDLRGAGAALPLPGEEGAFDALHRWSIEHRNRFWEAVWRSGDVIADVGDDGAAWEAVFSGADRMAPPTETGARWFPGARLNFAENLLRGGGPGAAIIAWEEDGRRSSLSWSELRSAVRRAAGGFRALGVEPGDRIAGWLPNIPETVIAMLGATSIGAVWTSCSPDFGVDGIVDRFGQVEPKVLLLAESYRYAGKTHDCLARAAELLPRLPTVRKAVVVRHRGEGKLPASDGAITWESFLALGEDAALEFRRLPFNHPLYILYSSGTTGLPKCLVHSAGGTLLQHLKEHRLHTDLRPGERLFYFTTCGWMMWNWLVSGLASGAALILYDGAPLPEAEPDILWRMAAEEGVTVFGTSAKYLALAGKAGLRPSARHDLWRLRAVLSTGSPLAPEEFDWVAREVGARVQVASISGGTDIVSCFVLGNPISPVYRGEIQGAGLGMAVDVLDPDGNPSAIGTPGELVCTRPFPAMPIGFWNDPGDARYRAAYFEAYPGVWRHGDWVTRTPLGGFVISGRSDATLNPGGVRIGTAEIYRQVEAVPEVLESLVIGQRSADGADERVVLFVRLRDGVELSPELEAAIRRRIREGTSPHHVPKVIIAVGDLPRTRSGKLSELAVRNIVEGRPAGNVGALANPEALAQFRDIPELAR